MRLMYNLPLDSIINFFSAPFYLGAVFLCLAEWAFIDKFDRDQIKLIAVDLANIVVEIVFIITTGIIFFSNEYFSVRLFEIPSNWLTFMCAIILYDFYFYIEHFLMHRIPLLWAIHHVHHSSERYGLSVGFRISWFRSLRRLFFFYPLLLVGFEWKLIWAAMLIINA